MRVDGYHRTVELMSTTHTQAPHGEFGEIKLPSGEIAVKENIAAKKKRFPKDYLGKDIHQSEKGMPPVYVKWSGHSNWESNKKAGLFWSAEQMGLKVVTNDKSIRIEDLCWVLEKERLCKPITGVEWEDVELELAGDPAMEQMFKRQNMLATYLVAQIKMLAQLATGRSYNCIEWLTRTFSYTMLVNLATNKYLPYSIVDGFTALVRILYLDRYLKARTG